VSGLAYLWYSISPGIRGVFGTTAVEGNQRIASKLVLRELTYQKGEEFDSSKLAVSRQNILKLNLFSSVEFVPEHDARQRPIFPILIKLHEKPPRELTLGLGYNTETLFNVRLQWNQYNWLGSGRQLLLAATYSDITSALDARLIQPYLFSRETRGILEAIQARETYQTYTLNASRFRPRIDYFVESRLIASLGWRFEYLKFNSLDPRTIAAEGGVRRSGILSGPFASINYNTTDDPLDPRQGMILGLDGNVADHILGGDYRYWRVAAEIRKYQSLSWKTVLATRFKLGLADTLGPTRDIPLSERFYSGGENSVRGYGLRRIGPLSAANQPLGGLSLVEGSVELRRPLFWKLAGAVFFDCGQVSTHSFRIPIDALQCGYGPAISFATPVGPARVDLGFPTRRPRGDSVWQLYFSIGQFY
jgi:outer membrane protein assembly complex protein YaeT